MIMISSGQLAVFQTKRDSITDLNMTRFTELFVWLGVSCPVLMPHNVHQTMYHITLYHALTVNTHVTSTVLLYAR